MGYAITQKGQVTLPKRVRDSLGVAPGEEVDFQVNERGEVVIVKAGRADRPRALAKWRGFFGAGPSTDEVMAMTRGEE